MRPRTMLPLVLVVNLLANCGCLKWDSTEPDDILFRRAAIAADQGKYDVARLTLQTLVNTYPDSDRVPEARQTIESLYSKEHQANPTTAACAAPKSPSNDIMRFCPAPSDN